MTKYDETFIFPINSMKNNDEQLGDDSEDEHFYPQPARLAYREFFNLILTCLKGHEDQRDVLLLSLHKQLVHFVRCIQDVSVFSFETKLMLFYIYTLSSEDLMILIHFYFYRLKLK